MPPRAMAPFAPMFVSPLSQYVSSYAVFFTVTQSFVRLSSFPLLLRRRIPAHQEGHLVARRGAAEPQGEQGAHDAEHTDYVLRSRNREPFASNNPQIARIDAMSPSSQYVSCTRLLLQIGPVAPGRAPRVAHRGAAGPQREQEAHDADRVWTFFVPAAFLVDEFRCTRKGSLLPAEAPPDAKANRGTHDADNFRPLSRSRCFFVPLHQ